MWEQTEMSGVLEGRARVELTLVVHHHGVSRAGTMTALVLLKPADSVPRLIELLLLETLSSLEEHVTAERSVLRY